MALTVQQQVELNKFPVEIRSQYYQQCRELKVVLAQVILKEPAAKDILDKALTEIEMSLFESAFLFNLNDTTMDMSPMFVGPILAQGVVEFAVEATCDEYGQELCDYFPIVPMACGVAALTIASYTNVGRFLFTIPKADFTSVTVKEVQSKIQEYFTARFHISEHQQKKLIIVLYYMLLKVERQYLTKIVSSEDSIKKYTTSYFVFGSLAAMLGVYTETSLFHRVLLSCATGYMSIRQRYSDCGSSLINLFRFCNEDKHRFVSGLTTLIAIYAHKDLKEITRSILNLLPLDVLKETSQLALSLKGDDAFEHLVENKAIDSEKLIQLRILPGPVYKQPALINKSNRRRVAIHHSVSAVSPPIVPTVIRNLAGASPRPITKIAEFQQRIIKQIKAYSDKKVVSAGWEKWLSHQKFALGVCLGLLVRIEAKEKITPQALTNISTQLQHIILQTDTRVLKRLDWKLTDKDAMKALTQPHFILLLEVVRYFEQLKCMHLVDWLSGFYPYLPAMTEERLVLSDFALELLKHDVHLREIGSSIYWPVRAEDIDIVLWSATKSCEDIASHLCFLSKHHWLPVSCVKDEKKGYATYCYKREGFKSFDVVLYNHFDSSRLKENVKGRAVNIASAVANVLFSWVYLLPEHAERFHRGVIDCSAESIVDKDKWFIITKTLWKMDHANQHEISKKIRLGVTQHAPQYQAGENLQKFRRDLYDLTSNVTLFHLIDLINKSLVYERIMGLWEMFLMIMSHARLRLHKINPDETIEGAHEKIKALLMIDGNELKGWLLLVLYSTECDDGFFRQLKLGFQERPPLSEQEKHQLSLQKRQELAERQQSMLIALRNYCLNLAINPYCPEPKWTDLPRISGVLGRYCQSYWREEASLENLSVWKEQRLEGEHG